MMPIDLKLDLVLERVLDVSRDRVWKAWTTPDLIKRWFTPAPWRTVECDIDLRPGGAFRTVMRSPDGEHFPHNGCFLEIVPPQRLVWTDALGPGFRPARGFPDVPAFTAIITLEPEGMGTRYIARAMHEDAAGKEKHEAMGFHDGWGAALDQLVVVAKAL